MLNNSKFSDLHVEADYLAADRMLLIEQSRIGAWLMLVLIPAGISLDYFVYPDRLLEFTSYRIAADFFVMAAIFMHGSSIEASNPRFGIILWIGSAVIMISGMIYVSDGTESSYYVGLVLVLLAIGILLPLHVSDVAWLAGITVLLFIFACVAPGAAAFKAPEFFRSIYFLALAVIIAVTAVYFAERRRRNEFNLRRELFERNLQLAELDEMKSRFFANISHELRTPLTLILAPVQEFLTRRELDPAFGAALKTIEASALRLLGLVNDLLDLVRFDNRPASIKARAIAIDKVAAAIVDQMGYLARQRGLSLTTEIQYGPILVAGDQDGIERILMNLVGNAIKFTNSGGSIVVRVQRNEKSARLEVSDTGIGMTQAEAEKVFDRFQQASSSPERRAQGVGLGLALVKELVALHGGTVEVDTALKQGTTMRIILPLASTDDASSVGALLPPPSDEMTSIHRMSILRGGLEAIDEDWDGGPVGRLCAPTILVVDDEPELRHFLIEILAREFRVYQAADGKKALTIINSVHPELVLLDLMLPALDGLEVCRQVKDDEALRSTKVILLTARIDEGAKLEALSHGADDFLTKPFSTVEVLTRLRNLHRSAQLERQLSKQNSELRETLTRLREAEAQLFQREKLSSLGTMAAGLLHEVNNPLNYVGMAIAVAKKNSSVLADERLADIVNDVEEGVKRVQRIVTDLRTFATARPLDDLQPFNAEQMVRQAIRFAATELSSHRVDIEVPSAATALGNEQQISQVMVNLLLNAARACALAGQQGHIKISVIEDVTRLRISVADTGIGIEPDRQHRIFDPFYTTSEVGDGMGLGLSVSHSLVQRHGGTLTVSSKKDLGTVFTFDIARQISEEVQKRPHVSVQ